MKRLVFAVVLVLVLVSLGAAGCGEEEPAGMALESGEVVSSCVGCHTDKDLLKEVASEPEKVASEETTGEG
jgi:hypothetical protein